MRIRDGHFNAPLLYKSESLLRLRVHPVARFEEGESEVWEIDHREEGAPHCRLEGSMA